MRRSATGLLEQGFQNMTMEQIAYVAGDAPVAPLQHGDHSDPAEDMLNVAAELFYCYVREQG